MIEIAFRTNESSTPFPQVPRLPEPAVKGFVSAQPWQCRPWVDAQTLGVELSWPWNFSLTVANTDGKVHCRRTLYGGQQVAIPADMSLFADGHYGVSSHHQLALPKGWDGLLLPHPRFYDPTQSNVPALVPGVLGMDYWPMVFFVVFKHPEPGKIHVFAAGQPFCQVVPVPRREIVVRQMTEGEQTTWKAREAFLEAKRYQVATHVWKDDKGDTFDNRYKILPAELKAHGWDGVIAKYSEPPSA